jgi:hypothetical protein
MDILLVFGWTEPRLPIPIIQSAPKVVIYIQLKAHVLPLMLPSQFIDQNTGSSALKALPITSLA